MLLTHNLQLPLNEYYLQNATILLISSLKVIVFLYLCSIGCPQALYEIMLESWHKDPFKRPTFETLQWKLEDFFTLEGSEYKEASIAY